MELKLLMERKVLDYIDSQRGNIPVLVLSGIY